MFKWYVENETREVVASGVTENYTQAAISCGNAMQVNPNTSETKKGYMCRIYDGNRRVR